MLLAEPLEVTPIEGIEGLVVGWEELVVDPPIRPPTRTKERRFCRGLKVCVSFVGRERQRNCLQFVVFKLV